MSKSVFKAVMFAIAAVAASVQFAHAQGATHLVPSQHLVVVGAQLTQLLPARTGRHTVSIAETNPTNSFPFTGTIYPQLNSLSGFSYGQLAYVGGGALLADGTNGFLIGAPGILNLGDWQGEVWAVSPGGTKWFSVLETW